MLPRRITRSRVKGWRQPDNTKYVGRGTMWGNPYRVVDGKIYVKGATHWIIIRQGNIDDVIAEYRKYLQRCIDDEIITMDLIKQELAGKNLSCFCKEGEKCHADILLEIANGK